jgi:hypothetical protein
MVYDATVAVMGMIHGTIGVAWMGVHVGNELYLAPDLHKAQKLMEVPALRGMKRISIIGATLGMLTLLSGLTFMFVKWGFDFGRYTEPEPRTVVIALVIVVGVIGLGMGVLRPFAMKLGKAAASMNPTEPFPAEFKADLGKLAKFLRISSLLVLLAFLMMILAINGGI